MTAVDTNVIVRLLAQDDKKQYEQAYKVFQKEELFIPDTVLLETEWVLRYAYKLPTDKISLALTSLMGLPNVCVTHADKIHDALDWHRQGLDFADALHLADGKQCDQLVTFDKKFATKSGQLSACSVTLL